MAQPDRPRASVPRPIPRCRHRRMVARSAYAQLGIRPLLAGTIAAWRWSIWLPPVVALFGHGLGQRSASLAWASMAIAFQPMLRFYRLSPLWGPSLPLIALAYMAFTLDSAYQYARKRGGLWKGRVQSNVNGVDDGCPRLRSGKGHRDENFPVASWLIQPRHRAAILAFYRFRARRRRHRRPRRPCRPTRRSPARRAWRPSLLGEATAARRRARCAGRWPSAAWRRSTRRTCSKRSGSTSKLRYADWDELMAYCALFGDAGRTFRARRARREPRDLARLRRDLRGAAGHQSSAGLRADYRNLDRVYLPLDRLPPAASTSRRSARPTASPALRRVSRGSPSAP